MVGSSVHCEEEESPFESPFLRVYSVYINGVITGVCIMAILLSLFGWNVEKKAVEVEQVNQKTERVDR